MANEGGSVLQLCTPCDRWARTEVERRVCSPMMLRRLGDDCWPLEDLEVFEVAVP